MTKKKVDDKKQIFRINSFVSSGTKDLIIINDKKEFLKIVGEGDLLVDPEGTAYAYNQYVIFVCEEYETK